MAEFRNIHTRIWKDEWFCELPPDARLLFIYLFSNERASVCGLYELPIKFMSFEVGMDKERVTEILRQFEQDKKVYYREGYVWVVNLQKYNNSGNSPKVQIRVQKDLAEIPDCEIKRMYYLYHKIPYRYPTDTLSGVDERDGDGDGDGDGDSYRDGDGNRDGDEPGPGATPASFFTDDCQLESIYQRVTSQISIPSTNREATLGALRAIRTVKGSDNETVVYLSSFFKTWKDERHYSTTNTGWLTDWAVTGEIPTQKQNGSAQSAPAVDPRKAALQRMREEAAKEEATHGAAH